MWLKEAVKVVVLPPAGPLLVAIVGLCIAIRKPRRGIVIAFAGVIALVLFAMPVFGIWLSRWVHQTPPLDFTHIGGAQAVVILGGGTRLNAPEYGGATMNSLTLERVRYGALVARRTGLPILVSGGRHNGGPTEATLMRNALVNEFGTSVRWMESASQNTHQNAVRSAAMLKVSGVNQVILIGHTFDFPRSRLEFENAGIAVIPAPIGVAPAEVNAFDFVPSVSGLQRSYFLYYELLANALFYLIHS